MAEKVERRLAAILSADVVGYSRLVTTDEERTIPVLPFENIALSLYQRAVAIDPGFAEAYLGDARLAFLIWRFSLR